MQNPEPVPLWTTTRAVAFLVRRIFSALDFFCSCKGHALALPPENPTSKNNSRRNATIRRSCLVAISTKRFCIDCFPFLNLDCRAPILHVLFTEKQQKKPINTFALMGFINDPAIPTFALAVLSSALSA